MKILSNTFLALLISASLAVGQQEEQPAGEPKAPAKKLSGLSGPSGGGLLTDEQIAELKTEWTDEKSGKKLEFSAAFSQRSVSDAEKRKYVKSGKIPIRIVCELDEVKEVKGKKVYKRASGNCHLYIKDADGKVVVKKTVSLDKMCPS